MRAPKPSPPARARAPLPRADAAAQAEVIRAAHLFDAGWYASRHPEAAGDPLAHYLARGGAPGFEPNRLFDTAWYRAQAPEAAAAGLDPLYHYAVHGVGEGLDPHPLFDTAWYLACNDDVVSAGTNPLQHYLGLGGPEGRNVHPLFDTGHYLRQRPDVAEAGLNPLLHYLADGAREGVDPHPLFDTAWYLARHPEVAVSGENPLAHYVRLGARLGHDPHPLFDTAWYRRRFPDAGENALLDYLGREPEAGAEPHPLFDSPWYLAQVPDAAEAGENPAIHYLTAGARAGLSPHPLLDVAHYLAQGPGEEAEARANPLRHYLDKGHLERGGRAHDPHPLFDAAFYRARNPDARGRNPLLHYVTEGGDRDPHPLFDAAFYRAHNDDLAETGRNPLAHFVEGGAAEGRDPHPLFDTSWYLARNPDVAGAGHNALAHFVEGGAAEGRDPHPLFDVGWYRSRNPDAAEPGVNPLAHYLAHGVRAAASPNPLFDAAWYRARHPELGPDADPLVDYIDRGVHIGSEPHPLFQGGWYLRTYPELQGEHETPLHHYLHFGAAEGRDPSPDFSTRWYLERHPDVAEAGLNPLAHYAAAGRAEGRAPLPLAALHARRVRAEALRLADEIQDIHRHVGLMPVRPLFVVLVGEGAADGGGEAARATRESVARQIYPDAVVPASRAEAAAALRNRADAHLVWLQPGDALTVRALYDLACQINRDPEAPLVTGNEEAVTADGAVVPFHKPAWSPDYLEGFDYVGRAACYRGAAVADLLGKARSAFDLTLRLAEAGARPRHLRRFLLRAPDRRRGRDDAERAAIADHLARTGRPAARVEAAPGARRYAVAPGPRGERVTLVARLALGAAGEEARAVDAFARRLAAIRAETSHRNLDAVAVLDRPAGPAEAGALRAAGCAAVPAPGETRDAACQLNAGAAAAAGAVLLFLDPGLEPDGPHWVERMLAQLDKPAVGAVGARLLAADGRIRHAGIAMNAGRPEAIREGNGGPEGYFFSAAAARNFLAVSGECLMTRAETFSLTGGFEEGLGAELAAVGYCLALREAGLRVVYEPGAALRDAAPPRTAPRGAPRAAEAARFDARWGARVADDPYYDAGALRLGPPDYDGRPWA